jgi:hypothetical protein
LVIRGVPGSISTSELETVPWAKFSVQTPALNGPIYFRESHAPTADDERCHMPFFTSIGTGSKAAFCSSVKIPSVHASPRLIQVFQLMKLGQVFNMSLHILFLVVVLNV